MPGVRKYSLFRKSLPKLLTCCLPSRILSRAGFSTFNNTYPVFVAPDALAQVKRGLKGLFGRKKRAHAQAQADPSSSQQQQLQVPSQTTSEAQNPTITTTAPSPLPGQNAEQKTRIGMFTPLTLLALDSIERRSFANGLEPDLEYIYFMVSFLSGTITYSSKLQKPESTNKHSMRHEI